MQTWQSQEAKTRFSEVIRNSQKSPQEITVRGEATSVIISKKLFERLTEPKLSFYDFMQSSPFKDIDLG